MTRVTSKTESTEDNHLLNIEAQVIWKLIYSKIEQFIIYLFIE